MSVDRNRSHCISKNLTFVNNKEIDYMELLNCLPSELKSKIRELGNLKVKLINNSWSNVFNEVSLNEKLMPKYINSLIDIFRLYHVNSISIFHFKIKSVFIE